MFESKATMSKIENPTPRRTQTYVTRHAQNRLACFL